MIESPTSTASRLHVVSKKDGEKNTPAWNRAASKTTSCHHNITESVMPSDHQKSTPSPNPTLKSFKDHDSCPKVNTTNSPPQRPLELERSSTITTNQISPNVMALPLCKMNKTPLPAAKPIIKTTGQPSPAPKATSTVYSTDMREGFNYLDYSPSTRRCTSEGKAIMEEGESSTAEHILPRVEQNRNTIDADVDSRSASFPSSTTYTATTLCESAILDGGDFATEYSNSDATLVTSRSSGAMNESRASSLQTASMSSAPPISNQSDGLNTNNSNSNSASIREGERKFLSHKGYFLPRSSLFIKGWDECGLSCNGKKSFSLQPRRVSDSVVTLNNGIHPPLSTRSSSSINYQMSTAQPQAISPLQRSLTTTYSSGPKSVYTTPVRSNSHQHKQHYNSKIDNTWSGRQSTRCSPLHTELSSTLTPRSGNPIRVNKIAVPERGGGPASPSNNCKSPMTHTGSHGSAGGSRTNPEILKTLLRKKACLYEVDTSKAIALITWIVGRYLGMKFGYFSRQQLQSGVHHVVVDKIEAGLVTRTKVNRCMQIILNSCFHYIIPRPDGVESGDTFRQRFILSSSDDTYLMDTLAKPWNEIDAESALHSLQFCDEMQSIASENMEKEEILTSCDASDGTDSSRRMVLLSFNDNVRCFEDVFRCHNEFIRDTANSANVNLTAEEWHSFFVGPNLSSAFQADSYSSIVVAEAPKRDKRDPVSSSCLPRGIEPRQMSEESLDTVNVHRHALSRGNISIAGIENEILGQMSTVELCRFRSSWCAKRYDHDPKLCAFGHVDVNRGWLRRDPSEHDYDDIMCPHVVLSSRLDGYVINACPEGVYCKFAHSKEECLYHPRRYKTLRCEAGPTCCSLKEICPNVHIKCSQSRISASENEEAQITSKAAQRPSTSSPRHPSQHNAPVPSAPMLYIFPSPESDFEKNILLLPGLKDLFRRRSTVLFADCQGQHQTRYTIFNDQNKNGID